MIQEIPAEILSFLDLVSIQASRFMFLFVVAYLLYLLYAFIATWFSPRPRWREATLHSYLPLIALARWQRFRWKHQDCFYWMLPVRFDKGDIVVQGVPTESIYWSFTYYIWTELNSSVSSETIKFDPDGGFTIRFGKGLPEGDNFIPVRKSARFGVLFYRIYEPAHMFPNYLPRVTVGGREISSGGAL